MDDYPTPTNGRPFYCHICGAGFDEFMACEGPDCQLETKGEAEARQASPKETK